MQCIRQQLSGGSLLLYSWFEAMHTRMDLMLWDSRADEASLQNLSSEICDEVCRIEKMGSCYLQDSELTGINTAVVGSPVTISHELYEILSVCLDFSVRTDGYFDIAASPGVSIPLREKIVLGTDYTVIRMLPDVRLNLSGFLKGYSLDRAVELVRKANVRNALLNFGNSSVFALGNHPSGSGWPVADLIGNVYVLHDECLTTSGNETDERRHIINPLTGQYIEGRGVASVVTTSAAEGEVESTVAFIKRNLTELSSGQ